MIIPAAESGPNTLPSLRYKYNLIVSRSPGENSPPVNPNRFLISPQGAATSFLGKPTGPFSKSAGVHVYNKTESVVLSPFSGV